MSEHTSALGFAAADDGEELARAELYGLLARLRKRKMRFPMLLRFPQILTNRVNELFDAFENAEFAGLRERFRGNVAFVGPAWNDRISAYRVTCRRGGYGRPWRAAAGGRPARPDQWQK